MNAQKGEMNRVQCQERLVLERMYESLDRRFQRPAEDAEICSEMKITLDEFYRMLDRIKGVELGSFQETRSGRDGQAQIRYISDASQQNSGLLFRKSELKEILTGAIEALPEKERLFTSLFFYEGLTLQEIEAVLGIGETSLRQLQTKATLRLRSRLRGRPCQHSRLRRMKISRRRRSRNAA